MTANLVNHIDAKFGGEYIRFDLRDEMVALEVSLAGGAYACLNRLVSGEWVLRDVQLVLSAAIPERHSGINPRSPEASIRRMNRSMKSLGFASGVFDSPFVLEVLKKNPPARYAVLAMKIVEAALFGIAEDQASFDENEAEAA